MPILIDLREKGPGFRQETQPNGEIHHVFDPRNLPVEGIQNDPPAALAAFNDYVVGDNPTGAWSGHAGEIARVEQDLQWGFYPAGEGSSVLNATDRMQYDFRGGVWAPVPGGQIVAFDPTALHLDGADQIAALDAVVAGPGHRMLVEDVQTGELKSAAIPTGGGGGGGAFALVSSTPLAGASVTIPLPASAYIRVHIEGLKISSNKRAEVQFSDGVIVFNGTTDYRGSYDAHQAGLIFDGSSIKLGSSDTTNEVDAEIALIAAASADRCTKYEAESRTWAGFPVRNTGRQKAQAVTSALVITAGGGVFSGGVVEVWA